MEVNHSQAFDSCYSEHPPRKYIYRSVEPVTDCSHPLRRSTDIPHEFRRIAGQTCARPLLLRFLVYLKRN
jgi:hypothetical protein